MQMRPGLSEREIQVLKLVVAGMTNRAIAAELNISRRTVETHRAKMRMRLQLGTGELIEYALSTGIAQKAGQGGHVQAHSGNGLVGESRAESRSEEEASDGARPDA
jgi:DNA-binding NarL/FixJ family response regulator